MRVKMSKPPPPAPTASAIGPCPIVIKIVGRPGTGSLPSTIAPPQGGGGAGEGEVLAREWEHLFSYVTHYINLIHIALRFHDNIP